MKSTKNFIMFGVQILVLIVGVVGFYLLNQAQVKPTTVYVYTRALETGDILTHEDIKAITVPADVLAKNPNLITDPNDFYYFIETEYTVNEEVKKLTDAELDENDTEGENMDGEYRESSREYLYKAINTDVFSGEFVTAEHLAKPLEVNALKTLNYEDLRLISIPLSDENILSGLINRGDRVDLLYTGAGESAMGESGDEFYYTTMVIENVVIYQVLTGEGLTYESQVNAYDKGLAPEDFGTSVTGEEGSQVTETPAYVVVAVTPEQAEEIKTRMQTGDLSIIGRFPESISKGDSLQDFIMGTAGKLEAGLGSIEGGTVLNDVANVVSNWPTDMVETPAEDTDSLNANDTTNE